MKTTKLFGAFLLIFALAFLSTLESCTKDNDASGSTSSVSKTGLLTSGGWVNTSFEVVNSAGSTDMFMFIDECDKDDQMLFGSDKSISEDAGTLKCSSTTAQTSKGGNWSFNADETKLEITEDGEVIVFDVVTLTSTNLVISSTEHDPLLKKDITVIMGYTH